MATVEKIRKDIEKTKEKISAQQKRLRELEAQLTALQSDIASGKLALRAEGGDAPKKTRTAPAGETGVPKAARPAPKPLVVSGDAQEVWKQTLTLIAKNNPPLLGLIRNEKFIGEKDGVYRICLPLSKKGISFEKLNQPNWKKQSAHINPPLRRKTISKTTWSETGRNFRN